MLTLPIAGFLIAPFSGAELGAGSWTGPGLTAWAAFANSFGSFAHAAAPIAVTALWQGALVAAGLALCLRFAPRVAAAHRFAAWAAGFAALMALPFVPGMTSLFAPGKLSNNGFSAAASLPQTFHPWFALSDGWCIAIAALWLVVALARAADLIIHSIRLRRLWKSATAIRAVLPLQQGNGNSAQSPRFELCTTRELDRPSVIGFFAPRILIPEWLIERLTRQELEQVVLHEAEHLRRHDDWTNLLQKLCLVVFPLNPALAFIERCLCREREMACDEGVVRRTQAPRAYAACLAGLAERGMQRRAEALSLGAFERRPELARRVHSILLQRSAMNPAAGRALLGALGCALAFGAVELARCPQLVAFVPAQPKAVAATAQKAQTDFESGIPATSNLTNTMAAHFRAMNVVATAPETARREATVEREPAPAQQAWQTKFVESAMNAALASKTKSAGALTAQGTDAVVDRTMTDRAASGASIPQELVVLTAFERVQGSGDELGDRVIRDSGNETTANARPGESDARQITITRLVFRVYPALNFATAQQTADRRASMIGSPNNTGKPAGEAAQGNAAQRNSASQHLNQRFQQPVPIPLGNGWFVIQL